MQLLGMEKEQQQQLHEMQQLQQLLTLQADPAFGHRERAAAAAAALYKMP